MARQKQPQRQIHHGRDELTRAGFAWIKSRTCKLCGVFIEIWRTDVKSRVALEVRPDEEWKLFPHVYYCRGVKKPKPAPQSELLFT